MAEPVKVNPVLPEGTIDLLCIGRLAKEKSQNTLLQAMRYSRYADRIRLNFAGNGPKAKYYKKMAEDLYKEGVLKIPASFGFYTHDELREMARKSYLYIHCAWVEVEGLSCLEAIQQGVVPVIAQGELIGTPVFALCGGFSNTSCGSGAASVPVASAADTTSAAQRIPRHGTAAFTALNKGVAGYVFYPLYVMDLAAMYRVS